MHILSLTPTLLPLLALLPGVSAHGYLAKVTIDGTDYVGNVPNAKPDPSPIRQIDDIGPVKGASNPFLNCGQAAALASVVAPANSGSKVQFLWGDPGATNWPHNTGPLMTYMAQCTGTTCDKFNGSTAQWFKIDEIGKKPDGTTWYQQDVMNGQAIEVTLPQNLAPGDYLIRHEIIALHLANSLGGAEFYPSCTQVRIGGSGTGTPNATVLFPGAYNDNDPGIFDPDVFNPGQVYAFPGPPISNLASASDSSSTEGGQAPSSAISGGIVSPTNAGGSKATSTPASSAPTASSTASSGKTCKLRKQDSGSYARKRGVDAAGRKRHFLRSAVARSSS
ncbi:hypothetical protein BV25DRAFT_1831790 [Artomyces pyxidatus]|uniref:Uncharacterized protein n=1 Tax=Artomyces pyxidatus TaxID=48021 RepID=A0ACB8SM93_9AGAM|nr:hypothetical protein BV25DRAFT_1831790 [Artomyces pyxidatus]